MDEEKPTSWGALIPEFYFDLIGRVPAGTVLATFFAYRWIGPTGRSTILQLAQEGKLEGVPFATILALLVFSGYALGIVLSPLGAMVGRLYGHSVWTTAEREFSEVTEAVLDRYGRGAGTKHAGRAWHSVHRLMHDDLKTLHAHARVLLPKMAAEEALCGNLCVGVLIMMLVTIAEFRLDTSWTLMTELLLLAVALAVVARSRHIALIRRQFSYFRIASKRSFESAGT